MQYDYYCYCYGCLQSRDLAIKAARWVDHDKFQYIPVYFFSHRLVQAYTASASFEFPMTSDLLRKANLPKRLVLSISGPPYIDTDEVRCMARLPKPHSGPDTISYIITN